MKISNENVKARGIGGFMSGVLVLSFSTVLVKIIGLAVKIPMLSILGAVGMGYFNSAVEIYSLLCTVSTAGLPVALSMLISTRREQGDIAAVQRVYKNAKMLFLVIGVCGSGVMLIFPGEIAGLIGNSQAVPSIIAIAPAVLLICMASAVRGYFQGFENMVPTAVSQLIEAMGKLLLGVGFGYIALKMGAELPVVAGASVLGLTLGILISTLYLSCKKIKDRRFVNVKTKNIAKGSGDIGQLLKIALPITFSSAILSLCRIIDMALILRRLQETGMSEASANGIYGAYTTLAVPVFALVPSLITPISLSLVPRLSSAIESGDLDGQLDVSNRAQRLTVLLSMPASMGIALYSTQILSLLFSGQEGAVSVAAPLLSVLGISVLFSGMITTTNAILQSYRQTVRPIVSMAIGSAVKILAAYLLIGVPKIGVYGAPISTLLCNFTVTTVNLIFLERRIPNGSKGSGIWQLLGRPFLASVCAIFTSYSVYLVTLRISDSQSASFLLALMVAVAAYAVFVILFRAVRSEDISEIPILKKLVKVNNNKK